MIQHEIDHLDGVLMLDPDRARPAQGGAQGSARGRHLCAPASRRGRRRERRYARHADDARARRRRDPFDVGGYPFNAGGLRTAYLGTSEFAATVLRRLAGEPPPPGPRRHPARPAARGGRKLASPPAADAARDLGLELHQTADVNSPESIAAIRDTDPRAIAVCAFGQLIKEPLLSDHLMLNVHPSLVPRWRGAAPIERALMAGDAKTGVTIMRVTAGLDSGPIALRGDLDRRGRRLRVPLRAPRRAGRGDPGPGARRARGGPARLHGPGRIGRDLRREDRTRGTTSRSGAAGNGARAGGPGDRPHIGAHLELEGGGRLRVCAASAVRGGPSAGEIEADGGGLLLGCSDGALRLDVVQPPGGRPMSAADFLRGHSAPSRAR